MVAKRKRADKATKAKPVDDAQPTLKQGPIVATLATVLSQLTPLTATPETFVGASDALVQRCRTMTKLLYDVGHSSCTGAVSKNLGPFPSLIIEGFDEDQVWEEIQLSNDRLLRYIKKTIKTMHSSAPDEVEGDEVPDEQDAEADHDDAPDDGRNDESEEGSADDTLQSDDNDDDDEDEDDDDDPPCEAKDSAVSVDDGFFSMSDMNRFLAEAETEDAVYEQIRKKGGLGVKSLQNNSNEDNEGEDEEDEEDEEEEARCVMMGEVEDIDGDDDVAVTYADYFQPPQTVRSTKSVGQRPVASMDLDDMEGSDDEDEGGDDEDKDEEEDADDDDELLEGGGGGDRKGTATKTAEMTRHQRQQDKIRHKILQLEEQAVDKKPWALRGEVTARDRPENSLLESVFEFDHATKTPLVITEQTTTDIETMIRRRIVDGAFDDIMRKIEARAATEDKAPDFSDEQNKDGLGEIYAKEYEERALKIKAPDSLDAEREAITTLFQQLCYKLDALSNYHFTPRPPKAEMEVRAAVPALQMEEAMPIAVSAGTLLAPEEVYTTGTRKKSDIVSNEELSVDDRKRIHRARKRSKHNKLSNKQNDQIARAAGDAKFASKLQEKQVLSKTSTGVQSVVKQDYTKSSQFFGRMQAAKEIPVVSDIKKTKKGHTVTSASYRL